MLGQYLIQSTDWDNLMDKGKGKLLLNAISYDINVLIYAMPIFTITTGY